MTAAPLSLRGFIALLGAALFFSLMSVLVKIGGRDLPAMELVLARGLVTLVLSYAALLRRRINPFGQRRPILLIRAACGTIALMCFYFAVTRLPLAEVTVIHFLNPLAAAALAALTIGEPIDGRFYLAVPLSLIGVLLVAKPVNWLSGAPIDTAGVLAALCGALLAGGAYVAVRAASRTEHPLVIIFYFPFIAVPATLPFVLREFVMPRGTQWLVLLGIGVTTQIAQLLLTDGLRRTPAAIGTAVGYAQIVFAALWGLVFFAEQPDQLTVIGAALVALGTLLLAKR